MVHNITNLICITFTDDGFYHTQDKININNTKLTWLLMPLYNDQTDNIANSYIQPISVINIVNSS